MRRTLSALCFTLSSVASAQTVLTNQDDCANAALDTISGPGALLVDTTNATTGVEGQNEPGCLEFGWTGIANDIWFVYTPSTTGTASFAACGFGPMQGGKIAVWPAADGCPVDGTSLGCDGMSCQAQGGGALVEVPVTYGRDYLVQVGTPPGFVPPYTGTMFIAERLGTRYCDPAVPNSTGSPAEITALGSGATLANDVTLSVAQLPPGEFGYFLTGRTQGLSQPPGSQGRLCLAGNIGRYDQDIVTGPYGQLTLDLTGMPVNPTTAVLPGETWNFQCWYRDGGTSNFSDALEVTFR